MSIDEWSEPESDAAGSREAPFALVTGASGGVGSAVAHRLYRLGWKVLATGRSARRLQRLRDRSSSERAAGELETIALDLCRTSDIHELVKVSRSLSEGLNALVISHGIYSTGMSGDPTEPSVREVFGTNVTSRIELFRSLLPSLTRASGFVFVMNSTASMDPRPDAPVYAASMAGSASFFRSVRAADEILGRVRVCSIFLGRVDTDMQAQARASLERPPGKGDLLDPEQVAGFVCERLSAPVEQDLSEVVLRAVPSALEIASAASSARRPEAQE